MQTLSHPAVAVAVNALADGDHDLVPVTMIVRDEIVAVLLDGRIGRWVVFVRPDGDSWVAPGMIIGTARPDGNRDEHTPHHLPLSRMSTKRFTLPAADGTPADHSWFAITGVAARDAVSVHIETALESQQTPVNADGVAFAIARMRTAESPDVWVNTSDGQRLHAAPRLAS